MGAGLAHRALLLATAGAATTTAARLLHFNDPNGATSTTDVAGSTVTFFGNAQVTTSSPLLGSGSLLLDGSGDYVKSAYNTGLDFGTGDFCVEGFISWAALANAGIFHLYPGAPPNTLAGLSLAFNGTSLQLSEGGGNTNGAFTPTLGTRYHFAVFRIGTTCYATIGGVVICTRTVTTNLGGNDLWLGLYFSTGFTHNGKLDDIRVTKGSAVYSAAGFTPPTSELT